METGKNKPGTRPVPTTTGEAPQLLLVDGHAYAYRAFHAIRSLNSPVGQPTNAIFGFVKTISRLRAGLQPTHCAVVWDGGLAAERVALLPGYKATRPPMPSALASQLDEIVAWVEASGVVSLCRDGVEADDWIATLAIKAAGTGAKVVIASSDKDFMQLVSPSVGLVNPAEKHCRRWTAAEVQEKTGVLPEQVVDWLSMVGDSVDDIPGVPGVGPKTAAALLRQFGSCEAVLARVDEVQPERLRAGLRAAADALHRNRQLIALRTNVGGEVELDALLVQPPNTPRLRDLFTRWGFRSLARELDTAASTQTDFFADRAGRNHVIFRH
jgi:DNA polymerase-1